METANLRNISIAGTGVIQGGEYDRVTISGSGKIDGNIQANEIKISGSGRVDGDVRTERMTISGTAKITGSVHSEHLINNGSLSIEEDVQVFQLSNRGTVAFHESVKASKLHSRGALSVAEDLDVEFFHSIGAFKVKETLTAKKAIIEISGKCYAEKIRVEEIDVNLSSYNGFLGLMQWVNKLFTGKSGWNRLETESIDGTKIHVDHVNAKVIRGDEVIIGPNSSVDLVEYRTSVKIDPKAHVKQQVRLEN